ncbi:MAG: MOSC domain-containing protein [Eggerthellaceae bacterium]|nr:MOSC domain-containing protein [Eggerthellaceae bacterium]
MGVVKAVCVSDVKGVQKTAVPEVVVREDWGIEGDAHAGKWHRQVSLLSYEKIEDFKDRGAEVDDGDFGENIIVEGFDLKNLPIGTKFKCNDVELELTQVGKKCHSHCAIYNTMGDCIMPREGVFTRVLHGGTIHEGDEIDIIEDDTEE